MKSTTSSFDELSADFVGAIREKRPTHSTIDDGLKGVELVLAASKSAREGGMPQQV